MSQMESSADEVDVGAVASIFFAGFMIGCALLQVRMVLGS
jgi:hypothetical protein